MSGLGLAWRLKWNGLRLLVALALLAVAAGDTGSRLARLQLSAMPGFDYLAEVRALRAEGRFGEALVIADAGLNDPDLGAPDRTDQARGELQAERDATAAEQASVLRRLRDVGAGALMGTGDTLEELIGAVAADFFVVGDVRDLVIQGGRLLGDGQTDEVVLVLSLVGLGTTLSPELDWVPAVLKAARKAGALSAGMSDAVVRAARSAASGQGGDLRRILGDARALAAGASPGGAVRLLRLADGPDDLARLARFVSRRPEGAFALHVTDDAGSAWLKSIPDGAALDAVKAGDDLLVAAARKGAGGRAWLASPAAKRALRPHALVGVLKGVWKGTGADLLRRALDALGPHAWWVVGLLAGWSAGEAGLLGTRCARAWRRRSPERGPR